MITDAQREVIKQVLESRYIAKITQHVEELGITNGRGNPHQDRYISMVFRQDRKDKEVENAIFELVEKITKEKELEAKRHQEIIDNAKNQFNVQV